MKKYLYGLKENHEGMICRQLLFMKEKEFTFSSNTDLHILQTIDIFDYFQEDSIGEVSSWEIRTSDFYLIREYDTDYKYYVLKSLDKSQLATGFNNSGEMDYMLKPEHYFEVKTDCGYFYEKGIYSTTEDNGTNRWIVSEEDTIEIDITKKLLHHQSKEPEEQKKKEEEGTWTVDQTTTYYFKDYLKEQLRSRYAFIDRPTDGLSNVVMDTYFPRYLYKHNLKDNIFDLENIPSTAVSISPLCAKVLGTKQIEIEQLIKILGYQKKDIKRLMTTVKSKNLNFVFVGAGGTSINTAYWLSTMARAVNITSLFKKVWVYEKDKAEISNLLRFPIDVSTIIGTNTKTNIIRSFIRHLSKTEPEFVNYFLGQNDSTGKPYYPYGVPINIAYETKENGSPDRNKPIYTTQDNTILYGAPTIESRENLSKAGSFISATHSDNGCSMYLNPEQYTTLQVESYGMIQLAPFFMNQLRMAIELLNILADPDFNPKEQNKELFSYSFDGQKLATTDRNYNFQIQQQTDMLTEEESANF